MKTLKLMKISDSIKQETADTSSHDEEQEEEREPLVVIQFVAGMSENIRRVCRKFNIRIVFKSGRTFRSMLTKVKDTLPLGISNPMWHTSYPLQLQPGLHWGDRTETERPDRDWRQD